MIGMTRNEFCRIGARGNGASRARRARFSAAAIAVAVVAASPARAAGDADAEKQAMRDQLKAMQAKLDKLEAKQVETERAADTSRTNGALVDAAVAEATRDANRRSQLMAADGGFTAGYAGGKFVIKSADGNFSFHPWLHLQLRQVSTYREDAKRGGTEADFENGFELRRAPFGFDGNLITPDLTYLFNWATNRGNGTVGVNDASGNRIGTVSNGQGGLPVLEEAWFKYKLPSTDFYLKSGQMHDPLSHETIVGSKYDITAERSIQNDVFANVDAFTQALTVIWDPKTNIRAEGGLTDGIRSANTNFQDPPANGIQYDYGLAGRVEFKAFGDWKEYDQFTTLKNKQDLLVFGFGVDYSAAGDYSSLTHAFDVQYASTSGLFLYGSYIGRYSRNSLGLPNGGPVSTSFIASPDLGKDAYEPSILVQASYLLAEHWEPFVRYEYMHLAGTPAGSNNDVHEISVGMTYWLYGHNAKVTGQMMYLPNGFPVDDSSSDVLLSNDKSELVLTVQFQLLL